MIRVSNVGIFPRHLMAFAAHYLAPPYGVLGMLPRDLE